MLTPRQLAFLFGLAGCISLLVAVGWAWQGVWYVLPFTLIEITGLLIAFFAYSRHATDHDRIVIGNQQVVVEVVRGNRKTVLQSAIGLARVRYVKERKRLVEVKLGAKDLLVGRFVPEGQRPALAQELSKALRG